jgi:site-specific recombinase
MKYELFSPILLFLIGVMNGWCFMRANRYTVHYKMAFQHFLAFLILQSVISVLFGVVPLTVAFYNLGVESPWISFLLGLFVGHIYGNKPSVGDGFDGDFGSA